MVLKTSHRYFIVFENFAQISIKAVQRTAGFHRSGERGGGVPNLQTDSGAKESKTHLRKYRYEDVVNEILLILLLLCVIIIIIINIIITPHQAIVCLKKSDKCRGALPACILSISTH